MANTDSKVLLPDLAAISSRLEDVAHSQMAIHRMAAELIDESGEKWHLALAVRELARSNIKGLQACLDQLGSGDIGYFDGEFTHD